MTKCLSVQLQPNLLRGRTRGLVSALRTVASDDVAFVELVVGQDRGPWVNAHFETADLASLWRRLRARLAATGLLAGTIVTCQGEHGWDDYLLLHHFDRGQAVRQLP